MQSEGKEQEKGFVSLHCYAGVSRKDNEFDDWSYKHS